MGSSLRHFPSGAATGCSAVAIPGHLISRAVLMKKVGLALIIIKLKTQLLLEAYTKMDK